jgi:hypothetical protein
MTPKQEKKREERKNTRKTQKQAQKKSLSIIYAFALHIDKP